MKISALLILAGCLHLSAKSLSQTITLHAKAESFETIFGAIQKQTTFKVVYSDRFLRGKKPVTVAATGIPLEDFLKEILTPQALTFEIVEQTILIKSLPGNTGKPSAWPVYQQRAISGTVKNKDGAPLENVSVMAKNSAQATTSNSNGGFRINLPPESTHLVFSLLGHAKVEVEVGSQSVIDVVLAPQISDLEEVVVVGYGTQRRSTITGAVTTVKMDDVRGAAAATGSIVRALDGRLPGVRLFYSGAPNGGASMLIRGQGTLNNNSPLYIIDGVPTTRGLNEIAANDIESVQLLKDASAATIYGSRAANGVIIVTTKKAKNGTQLQFSSATTANVLPENPLPLLNTQQYGRAQWMAARNDGIDPNYGVYRFRDHQDTNGNWVLDEVILPEWLDGAQTMRPADTDWQNEISRTGISQNYYATFAKGSENGRSLLSLDYLDNQGTTKRNKWNRITARLNSDYRLFNGRLKVGEDLSIIKMRSTGANYLTQSRNIQPIVPVRTVDGNGWGGPVMGMSDRINPVLDIERNKDNYADDIRILGSLYADVEIIKNLHFKTTFGLDKVASWRKHMQLKYRAGFMSDNVTKLEEWANYSGSWTWNNVLTYDFNVKKNNVEVLLGQEAMVESGADIYGARDGYAIEDPDYVFLNVGDGNVRNGGSAFDNALNSYFGKIAYNYDGRFLATAILRYDGSSKFGRANRYATFPSLSAGWMLSEEEFLKGLSVLSALKIRYGWGRTGNQSIPGDAAWGAYSAYYGTSVFPIQTGTAYDIYGNDSGPLPSGYIRTNLANPNLRWETTEQHNVGADFAFFDNRLQGSFDYYYKNTTDILVLPPYLSVIGLGGGRWINGASMENRGVELQLTYADQVGDFGYTVSLNASRNSNRITYLPEEAVGGYPGNGNDQTILGRPINSFFGWVADGIFQHTADVDAHAIQPGKGLGRIRYADIDGSGTIDADDRTWIGIDEPKIAAGLNIQLSYKALYMNMFWRGEAGRMVNNQLTKSYTHFFGFFGGQNYGTPVLDSWSPTNSSSTIPAITASDQNNEQRLSTYFIENASYIKLGAFELGYNVPERVLTKLGSKGARVYVQGQNLLTIAGFGKNPFSGYDPQLPNEDFPIPTSYSIGLNFTF